MTNYEKKLDELSALIAEAIEKGGVNSLLIEVIKKMELELDDAKGGTK